LLGERFEAAAREHADAVALVDGERRITYRELLARADALAGGLQARGIGPNDLVGVALPRSAELVIAIVGIVRAGAAYLPLDLAHPAERRERILADARPRFVIMEGTEPAGAPRREPVRRAAPGDLAYVIYTSGSTGTPNGVRVTQHNVARLFRVCEPLYGFGPDDVWSLFHSIAFDFSVWELWGALLYGGRLVVVPESTAKATDAFHALVVREEVTVLNQTPSAFRAFDMADAAAGRPASRLRLVIFGGEALDPRTLRSWFEAHGDAEPRLVNMYGITETTVHVTYRPMRAEDAQGSGQSRIGAPLADLRIELLGPDGQPVPEGQTGEIFVGGEGVADGYLERPQLTAERFRPDPRGARAGARLYRSGDLGRRLPGGDLEYLGRADLQVKLRGFRIELGEIEAALRACAGVRDAVVALREDPQAGPRLVAYLVLDGSLSFERGSLHDRIAERLPEYMLPAAYVQIASVPRTVNDKVDRGSLPAPTAADLPRAAGGEPPRDELERALAGVFADVLGTPVATRESDFFRLGGHSLLAWNVVLLCEERLGAALSLNAVFAHPTVASLAEFVRTGTRKDLSGTGPARVPRGGAQPLTPQQFALWLELRLRPDADAYNEPIAFRSAARLAPERVRRALERLAGMHEILRARLVEEQGEPRFLFDRSAADADFGVLEGGADLQAELRRPFELARGPLWRARMLQEPDGATLVLLVVHHMIFDAASEEILLSDFAAACSDPAAPAPSRAFDFCDLASHEIERMASERPALERFWASRLAGATLSPELPPPCVPCAPEELEAGGATRRTLAPGLAREVRALAARLGTTPFHVYFAAYLALLRNYTGSDDLVVGSPVSLRETPAARDVVGYLLSPVALRVELAGRRSFREAVAEVARRWHEVREHARLPLHLVLQAARGGRRSGVGSPFQVFFSLIHEASAGLAIDGQPLVPVYVPPARVKFQLFLLVVEQAEEACLTLEFRRGVVDPEMAGRLLEQFERMLRIAVERVDEPLSRLCLASPEETRRLLALGRCERPYPRDRTVPDLFEEVVRSRGEATALVAGTQELGYAALDRRANSVAAALRAAGVARGDRVPLLLARGARFVACALGVLKCGAAFVPLDPAYPAERLARMLEGLGARVGLRGTRLALSSQGIEWLDATCADEESSAGAPPRELAPTDAAYVMFTSGSTGRPKGVEVPHRAIVRLVKAQDFVRMGPEETWLHMAPTSFDASTLEIWAALLNGGRCVVIEDSLPTPGLLAQTIRRHGVTSAWFTAPLFNTLVDEAVESLTGLQQVLVGGEALSPAHMRRAFDCLPGVRFVNGYGPTENTTFTCCHVIGRGDVESGRSIPIGRPIANTSVFVLDRDGQPTPLCVPGELFAGGDGLALGYVGQPQQTAERFPADHLSGAKGARLYRTGDRVRWRADGTLEFLGRFDEQLKIRGHRIEPGEVAACLAEHARVRQAAVLSRRSSAGATQLVAYVVAQGEGSGEELARLLASHVAERLPAYMLPSAFVVVPKLPLKPNGKLDVEELESAAPRPAREAQTRALSGTEARVLAIWRDALRLRDLGPDDDFFESGGDSLLAVGVLVRVERELGIRVPVRVLVEGRSVRRLVAMLEDSLHSSLVRGVVRVRAGELGRALFCLPGLGGVALQFERMAARLDTPRAVFALELHDLELEPGTLESLPATAAALVRILRGVQPHGPYSILGYSYGGNLAVEVARELIREGEEVELLVALDAYAPGSLRDPRGLDKVLRHVRILRRLRARDAYAYLSSRVLRRLRLKPPEPEPQKPEPASEFERRLAQTEQSGLRAFEAHRPEPFDCRIVLVHATNLGDWMELTDPSGTLGWGAICTRGVQVIPIRCQHLDMFKEPNISTLARKLDEVLHSAHGA
jgi:amino acid adenylation domain-containing protein